MPSTSSTAILVAPRGPTVREKGDQIPSLVELLLELSSSVSGDFASGFQRGCPAAALGTGNVTCVSAAHPSSTSSDGSWSNSVRVPRKRRRHVLDAFFDTAACCPTSSPAPLRRRIRELFRNAKQNVLHTAKTHASMLELLCSLIAPCVVRNCSAPNGTDDRELSEAELMLYIVLRTSIAAAPTWQKPPVVPRCWLSSSITAIVERSVEIQQALCWSCDPDPVVTAVLGINAVEHRRLALSSFNFSQWLNDLPCHVDGVRGAAASSPSEGSRLTGFSRYSKTHCSWVAVESEDVRRLFERKRTHVMASEEGPAACQYGWLMEGSSACGTSPLDVASRSIADDLTSSCFSLFREVYPSHSPFCSLLYVALHRSVIGRQDPYLLLSLRQENSDYKDSPTNSLSPPFRSPLLPRVFATPGAPSSSFPCITVSAEFLCSVRCSKGCKDLGGKASQSSITDGTEAFEAASTVCSRGVMAMLQWSCRCGTLFLRLLHLCDVAERPEFRVALGLYGRSAITALRRLLFHLQRLVVDISERPGGPRGVSFSELVLASQRLRPVVEDVITLSDIFHVHAEAAWDPDTAIREISSATLLSALHGHYQRRLTNKLGCGTSPGVSRAQPDVVGNVFISVLQPLHKTLWMWICRGELHDPFDEFFVVASAGAPGLSYSVDVSPQRLPSFISVEAAHKILHAGISLRALRIATLHIQECVEKNQRGQRGLVEDVDAAAMLRSKVEDAARIKGFLQDFMKALTGYQRSKELLSTPMVDLLLKEGELPYWHTFYRACSGILLPSCGDVASDEAKNDEPENGTAGWEGSSLVVLEESQQPGEVGPSGSFGSSDQRSVSVVGVEVVSMSASVSHSTGAASPPQGTMSVDTTFATGAVGKGETGASTTQATLCREYELGLLHRQTRQRLQQWKAQRQSLNLSRASAISRTVDELADFYENARRIGPLRCGAPGRWTEEESIGMDEGAPDHNILYRIVEPLRQVPLINVEEDGAVDNLTIASPLCNVSAGESGTVSVSCSLTSLGCASKSRLPPRRSSRGEVIVGASSTGFGHLSGCGSVRGGGEAAVVAASDPFVHSPEMYVVADINDDEYLMKRAGPHVTDTSAADELIALLDAKEATIRNYDISSEEYQRGCEAAALEILRSVERCDGGSVAGAGRIISNVWWTDPTDCEEDAAYLQNSYEEGKDGPTVADIPSLSASPNTAKTLTERQAKNLLHCSHYYLSLGHFTANYLTHKAVQILLLEPYGILYRMTRQFLDVCLLQSSRVADRITGLWQQVMRGSLEKGHFNALGALATLNNAFVEEWEHCVPYGSDTIQLRVGLAPVGVERNRKRAVDEVESEVEGCKDEGTSGELVLSGTTFRRRARNPSTSRSPKADRNEEGTGKGVTSVLVPDNPFDFISRLCLFQERADVSLWPIPENAVSAYGDLFSTLLFWSSVSQLITRVWCIGIKSDTPEVFFFCNASRSVLNAVSQHVWYLVSGRAREYWLSLRCGSSTIYAYRRIEDFTTGHAAFLEYCSFAAMLTPIFASARRHVYEMVQQLEEVERLLLLVVERRTVAQTAQEEHLQPDSNSPSVEVIGKGQSNKNKQKVKSKSKKTTKKAGPVADRHSEPQPGSPKKPRERLKEGSKAPHEVNTKTYPVDYRRKVRDTIRRRLRSFAETTGALIEGLCFARDSIADTGQKDVKVTEDEEEEEEGLRGNAQAVARATALTSLIRVLESMYASTNNRI
ncbi:Spc97 / Spc98 family, putative [Trypanosoma equiperdum]|uniref:Spc97 / Spc98 family, putative n=1 Tax=Trypanosoma equiperdum TaxID=5694 RepID=A0A1G4IFG5_TRYEQ|nr:Spc97 / Spc98 family, putative [Trypanosoma equiperdum]